MDLWELERDCWAKGHQVVCGCDEAGAGPLAGRVYAAAVILPRELDIPGLNDSKKLTPRQRDRLYEVITAQAEAYSVAWAEAEEIDDTESLGARMNAMRRAMDGLAVRPDFALIDGNRDHGRRGAITTPHATVVKGDSLSASIAAASILAKVSRDKYMEEMAVLYPRYAFERHKGYPTKLHYERLRQYGPCAIHRRTFLSKL